MGGGVANACDACVWSDLQPCIDVFEQVVDNGGWMYVSADTTQKQNVGKCPGKPRADKCVPDGKHIAAKVPPKVGCRIASNFKTVRPAKRKQA
jgi:hypothetical protein